jgi:hypothetical protein
MVWNLEDLNTDLLVPWAHTWLTASHLPFHTERWSLHTQPPWKCHSFLLHFFFFGSARVWTQSLALARQALYLSSSIFSLAYISCILGWHGDIYTHIYNVSQSNPSCLWSQSSSLTLPLEQFQQVSLFCFHKCVYRVLGTYSHTPISPFPLPPPPNTQPKQNLFYIPVISFLVWGFFW